MKKIIASKALPTLLITAHDLDDIKNCKSCILGNPHPRPHTRTPEKQETHTTIQNSRLHIDCTGPFKPKAGDKRYTLAAVDEASGHITSLGN